MPDPGASLLAIGAAESHPARAAEAGGIWYPPGPYLAQYPAAPYLPLLGQSFLFRFASSAIDNNRHVLSLTGPLVS